MSEGNITLTRESVTSFEGNGRHVWPLKVTAVSTVPDLDSNIFVYHYSGGADPYQGNVFECVASLPQMHDIPVNAPDMSVDEVVPYFRRSTLFVVCRSPDEADAVWTSVQADVQDLIDNHRALSRLDTTETVTLS
jgi:hypothetical protein